MVFISTNNKHMKRKVKIQHDINQALHT